MFICTHPCPYIPLSVNRILIIWVSYVLDCFGVIIYVCMYVYIHAYIHEYVSYVHVSICYNYAFKFQIDAKWYEQWAWGFPLLGPVTRGCSALQVKQASDALGSPSSFRNAPWSQEVVSKRPVNINIIRPWSIKLAFALHIILLEFYLAIQ